MDGQEYTIFLIVIYIALTLSGSLAVFLYRKAYLEMKKTRMIFAIYILLVSILFENLYFGFVAIIRDYDGVIYESLLNPVLWCIPKIFMFYTLIYFICTSLSKNQYKP